MSDFFNRKESKDDPEIPEHADYDVTNFESDLVSCGITDLESFKERHAGLFTDLVIDSDNENPVAYVAQKIEKAFSKRELAFLMSKDILTAAYEESKNELETKKT
tara:strand:+ start:80 stop:394 length:315 start_codon:yes stop_codon:yes gene_type:complete